MGKGRKQRRQRAEYSYEQRFLQQDFFDLVHAQGMRTRMEQQAQDGLLQRLREQGTAPRADCTCLLELKIADLTLAPQGESAMALSFGAHITFRFSRSWTDMRHHSRELLLKQTRTVPIPEHLDRTDLEEFSLSLMEQALELVLSAARQAPLQEVLPPDPDQPRQQQGPEDLFDPALFRHIRGLDTPGGPLRWDLFPDLAGDRETARVFWDGQSFQALTGQEVCGPWTPLGLPFHASPGPAAEPLTQVDLHSTRDLFRWLPDLAEACRSFPPMQLLWPGDRDVPRIRLHSLELPFPLPENSPLPASELTAWALLRLQEILDSLAFLREMNRAEQALFLALAFARKIPLEPRDPNLWLDLNEAGIARFAARWTASGPEGQLPLLHQEDGILCLNRSITTDLWPPDPDRLGIPPAPFSFRDIPLLRPSRAAALRAELLAALQDPDDCWTALLEIQDTWSPVEILRFADTQEGRAFLQRLEGPDRQYADLLLENLRQNPQFPNPI